MAKRKAALSARVWSLLRMALLWARRGGAFKRALAFTALELRLHLRALLASSSAHCDRLRYGEREFSFDDTPAFRFKMHRPSSMRLPRIPCINPPAATDLEDGDGNWIFFKRERESDFFRNEVEKEECVTSDDHGVGDDGLDCEEEQGIDSRAEEFIAKFYQQMKLQRQVSLLEYNEMLLRGMS